MPTLANALPTESVDPAVDTSATLHAKLPRLDSQALDIGNVSLTFTHSNPYDGEIEGARAPHYDTGEIRLKDRDGEEIGSIVVSNLADSYEIFELLSIAEGPPSAYVTPDRLAAVLTIVGESGARIRSDLGSTPGEISLAYAGALEGRGQRSGMSQILVEDGKGEQGGGRARPNPDLPAGVARFVDVEQPLAKNLEVLERRFGVDTGAIGSWLRSAAAGSLERSGESVILGLQIYATDPANPCEVIPTPVAVVINRDEIIAVHHGKVPAISAFMDGVRDAHASDESRKGTGGLLAGLLGAVVAANRETLSRLEHQADLVDGRLRGKTLEPAVMEDAGKLAQSVRDVSRSLAFVKEAVAQGDPQEVFGVKAPRKAIERLSERLGDVLAVSGALEERAAKSQSMYATLSANDTNLSMKALTLSGLVLAAGSFFVPLVVGASEIGTAGLASAALVGAGFLYYLFRK